MFLKSSDIVKAGDIFHWDFNDGTSYEEIAKPNGWGCGKYIAVDIMELKTNVHRCYAFRPDESLIERFEEDVKDIIRRLKQ